MLPLSLISPPSHNRFARCQNSLQDRGMSRQLPTSPSQTQSTGNNWESDDGLGQGFQYIYSDRPSTSHQSQDAFESNALNLSFQPSTAPRNPSDPPEVGFNLMMNGFDAFPYPQPPSQDYHLANNGYDTHVTQYTPPLWPTPVTHATATNATAASSYLQGSPSPGSYISTPGSSQMQLSPYSFPNLSMSQGFNLSTGSLLPSPITPPSTPGQQSNASFGDGQSPTNPSPTVGAQTNRKLYSHRDQIQMFRDVVVQHAPGSLDLFVPQRMYRPHTHSDRRRYVEEVDLEEPIYFWTDHPEELGIPLIDVLHSRVKRLRMRDDTVFEGRGPSVSIRLEWPGYGQWSRQIPTKDFRSPPGPITRSKLAKNVAKCVLRFIDEQKIRNMEDDADQRWRVGDARNLIKLDDLILVSLHHVSMGSWQPHLKLRRPLSQLGLVGV